MKTTDIFRFYTDIEYRTELITAIRAARQGDRVLLMSMTFEPTEPEIAAVMDEAEKAAARGVYVSVAVDAHSFLVNPSHLPGPLLGRTTMPRRVPPYFHNKLQILERINAYPTGHADIINIPKRGLNLPIAGRSHIKAAIINDRVFLGGCNLEGGKKMDLMVSWHSKADADRLYTLLHQVIHGKHAHRFLAGVDRRMQTAGNAQVLIDSGVRRQSIIMAEALKLIDAAEEWLVITCQYFPNSTTAKHLAAAAKRGVKVEIIYSHPRHQGLIGGFGQQISILRERTRIPRSMFAGALSREDPMLHAKLIASDKGFMVGSHNYVTAGVILGTAEIALKSDDGRLAREAVRTLHRRLKKPNL